MYAAATGYPMTAEELHAAACRSKLLLRAILIRNHGRCRRMEIEEVWRTMSIPDSWGEVADWQQWNEMVDLIYEARDWIWRPAGPTAKRMKSTACRMWPTRWKSWAICPNAPPSAGTTMASRPLSGLWNTAGRRPGHKLYQ